MTKLLQRLGEPSTWAGLAAVLATAAQAWATKSPEAIGATVAGIAAMVMKESGRAD